MRLRRQRSSAAACASEACEESRGGRAATRENPAGLTARELEVLGLLAEGLRNAQIADRLVNDLFKRSVSLTELTGAIVTNRVRHKIGKIADGNPAFLDHTDSRIVFKSVHPHSTGAPLLDAPGDVMSARESWSRSLHLNRPRPNALMMRKSGQAPRA